MARTTRGIAADQAILRALVDGPLSTREIATRLRREACEDWADRHGYEIDWGDFDSNRGPTEPLGARLLALGEGRDAGLLFSPWEIQPRLYGLEKRGSVERIQIAGHRPMLWRLP